MAFFAPLVPVLAGIGGGSAVAGGILVGTTIASAGITAKSAHDAGEVASAEAKLQAKQAGDSARGREIERQRSLLQSLATQHAFSGAQGVAMQGSNVAIANRDIKYAREDDLADYANTRGQQRILNMRGANARRTGTLNAVTSLLDSGVDLARAAA